MYTYLLLINGILIQLAAATAENGTNFANNGGIICIKVFIFIYSTKAKNLHTKYTMCLMNLKALVICD